MNKCKIENLRVIVHLAPKKRGIDWNPKHEEWRIYRDKRHYMLVRWGIGGCAEIEGDFRKLEWAVRSCYLLNAAEAMRNTALEF